jgi:hypothetical protein
VSVDIFAHLKASNRAAGSATPLDVAIVDGSGAHVTSFGGTGGTSSSFGAAFPASGTAIGAKDSTGTNMAALNLDASGNLKISGSLSTTPTTAATAVLANVAASAVSGTALSANVNRLGMVFVNDCDKPCYLKYGATASATSYVKKLFPGEQWEPALNYTGRVDVIWDAAPTGNLRVTELSA